MPLRALTPSHRGRLNVNCDNYFREMGSVDPSAPLAVCDTSGWGQVTLVGIFDPEWGQLFPIPRSSNNPAFAGVF